MSKKYMKPAMKVYELKPARIICTSAPEFGYTPAIDNDMNHLA